MIPVNWLILMPLPKLPRHDLHQQPLLCGTINFQTNSQDLGGVLLVWRDALNLIRCILDHPELKITDCDLELFFHLLKISQPIGGSRASFQILI